MKKTDCQGKTTPEEEKTFLFTMKFSQAYSYRQFKILLKFVLKNIQVLC